MLHSMPDFRSDRIPAPLQHWLCLSVTHLAHLTLAVSSEERHVIDLIYNHKVLFLSLEVLQ